MVTQWVGISILYKNEAEKSYEPSRIAEPSAHNWRARLYFSENESEREFLLTLTVR